MPFQTSSGVGSLRNAIAIATDGDVITFAEAYTIYLQSPLVLGSKTINIYGKVGTEKVHLDGNFSDENNDTIDDDGVYSRIFTINGQLGVTITLSHLYIENGSVNPTINGTSLENMGGGMYINMEFGSELFIDTCTIQNNTLILLFDETDYSDFDNIDILGGGIYSKYGGNFTGCTIKRNSILVKKTTVSNGNFVDPIVLGGGVYAKNTSCN